MATKLTVKSNGSIRLEGDFELYDDKGIAFDVSGRKTVSLCRCGLSSNKPFCDGSHRNGGFLHESNAFALPPQEVKQ